MTAGTPPQGGADVVTRGGLRLPAAALRWRFSRSSGPGGQHVNTADTRAELVCDLRLLAGKPREVELVRSRFGDRIRVVCSTERSQLANRQRALARLAERLDAASAVANPRRPTRPPRGATEARLAGKHATSRRKADRQRPTPGDLV
ncbi:MAG: peptide chain release factor-like protein [Acidimicrobiales bacterium]